jgi:hypothetical protein
MKLRMVTFAAYDKDVEQLYEVMGRLSKALDQAGIEYRVVGGMAVYVHVKARHEKKARLTNDVDVAVRREDLSRIGEAVEPFGFRLRHAAGVDLLVDTTRAKLRSAVHFVFTGEKVRKEYAEPVPSFSAPFTTQDGVLLAPVADLVRMKLTSFRLKDQVHIQDLDSVRLITPEIEASLSPLLRERLAQVRASR